MAKGIVRKVDDLGRIVVPKEIKRQLGWESGVEIEITVSGETVSLRKHNQGCTFCGVAEGDHVELHGKLACWDCCKALIGQPMARR